MQGELLSQRCIRENPGTLIQVFRNKKSSNRVMIKAMIIIFMKAHGYCTAWTSGRDT